MRNTILTFRRMLRACFAAYFMYTKQLFDGGIFYVAGEYLVRLLQFVMLVCIWKVLVREGTDLGGMTLSALLTHTLVSSVLHQQLNIVSPATVALWEGSIIGRYLRPLLVIANFVVETVGKWWTPVFLFYGLPLWPAAPFLGIRALPADGISGVLTFISLAFSVAIGFAIDLVSAAFAIRLKNECFTVLRLRESIFTPPSRELIPFVLFPWDSGKLFTLTPFGSITHAPLSIYTGLTDTPLSLIGLQVFWCVIPWLLTLYVFRRSEERVVSSGG